MPAFIYQALFIVDPPPAIVKQIQTLPLITPGRIQKGRQWKDLKRGKFGIGHWPLKICQL
jgi:hypothetical protein